MAAAVSHRDPFVAPFNRRDAAHEAKLNLASGDSDLLTIVAAYDGWVGAKGEGNRERRKYCSDNFVSDNVSVGCVIHCATLFIHSYPIPCVHPLAVPNLTSASLRSSPRRLSIRLASIFPPSLSFRSSPFSFIFFFLVHISALSVCCGYYLHTTTSTAPGDDDDPSAP